MRMVLQQMLWFNIGDAKAFNRGCLKHLLENTRIGTIIELEIIFLFIVNRTIRKISTKNNNQKSSY